LSKQKAEFTTTRSKIIKIAARVIEHVVRIRVSSADRVSRPGVVRLHRHAAGAGRAMNAGAPRPSEPSP
jgi:hypothetical protein